MPIRLSGVGREAHGAAVFEAWKSRLGTHGA